jgi:hypothetical protein
MAVVAAALAAEVLSAPLPAPKWGVPCTLAAIAVLAVLFVRSAARSWPARAAVAVVSVTAGATWALAASWLTYSLAAAFTAVAVITIVRPSLSFWLAAVAMTALAGIDFIQVSVTHATVRAVAAGDPFAVIAAHRSHAAGIPGLIGIPGHVALLSPYAAMLGIGDVTLPGMLIVIAGRAGRLAGTARLYTAAVCGYGASLAACLAVAAGTGALLPAMVFLVPGVIVAVAVTAPQAGAWPALASRDLHRLVASPDAPQPQDDLPEVLTRDDPAFGPPSGLPLARDRPRRRAS